MSKSNAACKSTSITVVLDVCKCFYWLFRKKNRRGLRNLYFQNCRGLRFRRGLRKNFESGGLQKSHYWGSINNWHSPKKFMTLSSPIMYARINFSFTAHGQNALRLFKFFLVYIYLIYFQIIILYFIIYVNIQFLNDVTIKGCPFTEGAVLCATRGGRSAAGRLSSH